MYSKIAFLILFNAVLALAEKCDCSDVTLEQSLQDTNDIVEFLNRLSQTAPSEDEKYPAVLTGVITGSSGCRCENLRRKRKITPKEDIPLIDKQTRFETVRFPKGNCPKGYVRLNKRCMHAEILED